jgi:hypothetical protein
MRVFKVQDGSSWTARVDAGPDVPAGERRAGWEAVLFESSPAGGAARIVYRPAGWLSGATLQDLVRALEEGEAVRARWQPGG